MSDEVNEGSEDEVGVATLFAIVSITAIEAVWLAFLFWLVL